VIPNGIDETVFGYVPPRADRGEPWRLLYVGQLIPVKGLDYLVDALAILQRRCSVGLDLVYQVDTRLPALKARVDALRISGVRFLGNRSPSELAEIYAACDLLVLPSVSEALPSVISEAMLVGRPVVASDVGGIKDQIGRVGEL
jgi:glycosyltransferase involved in cell wall biosynthesis